MALMQMKSCCLLSHVAVLGGSGEGGERGAGGAWLPVGWGGAPQAVPHPGRPRASEITGERGREMAAFSCSIWLERRARLLSFLFSQCAFPSSLHATPSRPTSPRLPPLIIMEGKMYQSSCFKLSVSLLNSLELSFFSDFLCVFCGWLFTAQARHSLEMTPETKLNVLKLFFKIKGS